MKEDILAISREVSELCYCQKENLAMGKIKQLTEQLLGYYDNFDKFEASENLEERKNEMLNIFNALVENIEKKDYVMVADIIEFFLIPYFA